MPALLRLITVLAGNSVQRAGLRMARVSVLLALALLFLMIGLTGFAVAIFILLARAIDPALAALLLGALSCLIAASLLLIARAQSTPRHLRPSPEDQRAQQDLIGLLQTAGKTGIWLPLALALLAGFVASSRKK